MWVVGQLSFSQISSFFSLNLQHRPFSLSLPLCMASSLSCGLPPSLPYCPFLHVTFCLGFLSSPQGKEGTRRGKGREEKWCHTAMMPEHCLDGGEVEGVWVQRKRWGGRGGSSPIGVQPLGVEAGSAKPPSPPSCSSPAAPHACPYPSSCAGAAEFEGNTHRDTLVQCNPVFLGQVISRCHSWQLPLSVVYNTA